MDWNQAATIIAPIVQAIAAVIGAVGVGLVWFQVRYASRQLGLTREQLDLTVEQIRQQNAWSRINTQHTLLSVLPTPEAERELWRVVKKYRQEPSWQFPDSACGRLYEDLDDWLTIKSFVNGYERLCAAISANSLDEDYAYSVHGAKVIDTHNTFEHYIDFIRRKRNNATIYLELEKVATRWENKARSEQNSLEAEQARLRESRGTRRAVG